MNKKMTDRFNECLTDIKNFKKENAPKWFEWII